MANRVLLGRHPALSGNPYGLFVSKPTKNVLGTTHDDFAFRSDLSDSVGTVTSTFGQSLHIKHRGEVSISMDSTGSGQYVKSVDITYPRADFNDGTNDRCPLVFVQTSVITDTTIQNAVGFYNWRNTSQDYRTSQGFRFEVFPYPDTSGNGLIRVRVTAEAFADEDGDWPGTNTGTRKVYYALATTCIS